MQSFYIPVSKKKGVTWFTSVCPFYRPSVISTFRHNFSATIARKTLYGTSSRSLLVAYRIQVRYSSSSCFSTRLFFLTLPDTVHNFRHIFLSNHNWHPLGTWYGASGRGPILHVAKRIQVRQSSSSCFLTWFVF